MANEVYEQKVEAAALPAKVKPSYGQVAPYPSAAPPMMEAPYGTAPGMGWRASCDLIPSERKFSCQVKPLIPHEPPPAVIPGLPSGPGWPTPAKTVYASETGLAGSNNTGGLPVILLAGVIGVFALWAAK